MIVETELQLFRDKTHHKYRRQQHMERQDINRGSPYLLVRTIIILYLSTNILTRYFLLLFSLIILLMPNIL